MNLGNVYIYECVNVGYSHFSIRSWCAETCMNCTFAVPASLHFLVHHIVEGGPQRCDCRFPPALYFRGCRHFTHSCRIRTQQRETILQFTAILLPCVKWYTSPFRRARMRCHHQSQKMQAGRSPLQTLTSLTQDNYRRLTLTMLMKVMKLMMLMALLML